MIDKFSNRVLLITGGTGSFGTAVLEKFLNTSIAEIRIFSRDEKKQDDLRKRFQNSKIRFYIGDVRDAGALKEAMTGVDFVFHAAALKQVPSCEFYPMEAVKTNILGTENVLNTAILSCVKNVVVLSTDKAVYPVNAMGISKAMMEKVAVSKSRISSDTCITVTRYGNVLCSRGSVVPLFVEQIKSGLPVTITDPMMTRFLMTLDEAVDLVLFAFEKGNSGDIFVHKSPSASIGLLAECVNEIVEPGRALDTQVIGTRHGEKHFEVLVSREEMIAVSDLGKFFCIPPDTRDLNYEKFFERGRFLSEAPEEYSSQNASKITKPDLKNLLKPLLRSYLD